jgi:alanine racemase
MVMSPEEQSLDTLLKYNLEPEIYNLHILNLLADVISRNQTPGQEGVRIHLKLDTGMHRLGFQENELDELLEKLLASGHQPLTTNHQPLTTNHQPPTTPFTVVSIFSHLAASEDPGEDEFTREQIAAFDRMSSRITEALGYPVLRHILNSAGASRFPDAQFDMVRLGIGLYGIGWDMNESRRMRNVCTLRTTVIQVKHVKAGETVGYNRRWKAQRDSVLAVLPVGYADGLDRRLGNGKGKVWIRGDFAPTAGNICMDLCMIDVTDLAGVSVGDEAEIFGEHHPLTDLAKETGTIPYEIMTGISRRVKRVYFHES